MNFSTDLRGTGGGMSVKRSASVLSTAAQRVYRPLGPCVSTFVHFLRPHAAWCRYRTGPRGDVAARLCGSLPENRLRAYRRYGLRPAPGGSHPHIGNVRRHAGIGPHQAYPLAVRRAARGGGGLPDRGRKGIRLSSGPLGPPRCTADPAAAIGRGRHLDSPAARPGATWLGTYRRRLLHAPCRRRRRRRSHLLVGRTGNRPFP